MARAQRSSIAAWPSGRLISRMSQWRRLSRRPPPKPITGGPSTRSKAARNIGGLPKHLLREDVVIEPGIKACPCCQGTLHLIGEDVSEMLDVVPAIIRVKRIRRPRYSCRRCEGPVVQAPAPARAVEGGLPTTALLAYVAVSKFAWHLPLNRQVQMLAGHGITLDRSTLVHWDREGGMVAATAAFPPARDRDVSAEGLL
jgi:transposase